MRLAKLLNLLSGNNKLTRLQVLFEIRLNQAFWNAKPLVALELGEAMSDFPASVRRVIASGEAEEALDRVRNFFDTFSKSRSGALPFPVAFNADRSLAIMIYAFARGLAPVSVLECGVGYGISSALVLLALERNGYGILRSVDLPPLADPCGESIGAAVPEALRGRWQLTYGSSRQLLPRLASEAGRVDLFISDSANVFTIQKYEFALVFPSLSSGGVMIFNNVSKRFQEYLATVENASVHTIWQVEKRPCATIILQKE